MKKLLLMLIISSAVFAQTTDECPCCKPEYRQFHFWIGEWNVYDTTGVLLGSNTIELDQDNCLMIENWQSANNSFTGTSYNFYDNSDNSWNQTWVDNQGSNLKLKGKFYDNKMVLRSELRENKNDHTQFYHQISWTLKSDGTVIQKWDVFDNNNDLLNTAFFGIYKKVK